LARIIDKPRRVGHGGEASGGQRIRAGTRAAAPAHLRSGDRSSSPFYCLGFCAAARIFCQGATTRAEFSIEPDHLSGFRLRHGFGRHLAGLSQHLD
jgi:hypothetical protein